MVTIAMTREMGTLGKDVAQGLAESLNLKVIHSELVEHDLAGKLKVQESAVHHYLEGNASLMERWSIDKRKLSQFTEEEIIEIARQGNVVIRGWGAAAVLRSVPHVLRVRVCAPMAYRERNVMTRVGLADADKARREIERNDAAHAKVMRGFFGVNWEDPQLYHIVLNTGSVPVGTCVRAVRLLADDAAFQESEGSRAVLDDMLIKARARMIIDELLQDRPVGGSIDIDVVAGNITVAGVVGEGSDIAGAVRRLSQIDGVKGIANNIHKVARHFGT